MGPSGFDLLSQPGQRAAYDGMGRGWSRHIGQRLRALLQEAR